MRRESPVQAALREERRRKRWQGFLILVLILAIASGMMTVLGSYGNAWSPTHVAR
jgi:hypothetical protein